MEENRELEENKVLESDALDYNTQRPKLKFPEYGRYVLQMTEHLKTLPDKDKRSVQAAAVVKAMEILNPQVRQQEDYDHKLWDHLHMIAGMELDIDSPYPAPTEEQLASKPDRIPLEKRPIKATHYGRNIESIIDLISGLEEGPQKYELLRSLATYMRQQYLIWNKDSVADETIFKDIEKLSGGRIAVPEGLELSKISNDASFARPGMNPRPRNGNQKNNGRQKRKK